MNSVFWKRLKEAVLAILPITVIVLILDFAVSPMPALNTVAFVLGAVLLIVGTAAYSLGVDTAIEPIGSHIGAKISKAHNVALLLLAVLLIGCFITVAEPDLTVLANQVSIGKWTLILTVAAGVGVFMVLAVLRMFLKIGLRIVLTVLYAVVLVLVVFADQNMVPLAFDSGGVTTGPITVPFIMALTAGISAVVGGNKSQENSFGTIGIASIGPILVVLALTLAQHTDSTAAVAALAPYQSGTDVALAFLRAIPVYLKEVGIALLPITAFFLVMQVFFLKLPAKRLARISVGLVYTYLGLTLFLTGVHVGFMATGAYIGDAVARVNPYLTIPIGMVVGAVIVLAEPAIHVLVKQVEEITGGMIARRNMLFIMMASMAVAVGLSMLRVATGINILYILLPGYALALGLTWVVPPVFTGIAFDSGGVASGAMTATFLLPFAIGACQAVGGNILADAFGTIGTVAMTPLVVVQVLGLVYKIGTTRKEHRTQLCEELLALEGNVIELDWEVA